MSADVASAKQPRAVLRASGSILTLVAMLGAGGVLGWLGRGRVASDAPASAAKGAAPVSNVVEIRPDALADAGLELLEARAGKLRLGLVLPGEIALDAEHVVHVSPRVAGVVLEARAKVGDVVKKGQVLALVQSREFAATQLEFLAAGEHLTLAQATFKRTEDLYAYKAVAEKDYLAAKEALAVARLERDIAARRLEAVGGNVASQKAGAAYAVTAPSDGTIIDRDLALGEVIRDDHAIYTLADLDRVWVHVAVYPQDLAQVAVGARATVRAEGVEDHVEGIVSLVAPTVGEKNRAALARIVIEHPPRSLRPGLFADVDLEVATVDVPLHVAEDALQTVEGTPHLFVARSATTFEPRPVKLGRRGRDVAGRAFVEILGGLSAGDSYVGKGSFLLRAETDKGSATGE